MPQLSQTSKARLETCVPELQHIVNLAIQYIDFSVICGARSKEEQDLAVSQGNSKTPWPTSKHNTFPSQAVDIYPYIVGIGVLIDTPDCIAKIKEVWKLPDLDDQKIKAFVKEEFCKLAGVILMCARMNKYALVWGGDWDGDENRLEKSFIDLPHFEMKVPE